MSYGDCQLHTLRNIANWEMHSTVSRFSSECSSTVGVLLPFSVGSRTHVASGWCCFCVSHKYKHVRLRYYRRSYNFSVAFYFSCFLETMRPVTRWVRGALVPPERDSIRWRSSFSVESLPTPLAANHLVRSPPSHVARTGRRREGEFALEGRAWAPSLLLVFDLE